MRKWHKSERTVWYAMVLVGLGAVAAQAQTTTIGGKIFTGASSNGLAIFAPDPRTPAITDATVMVQNQHSGGAVITYGTMGTPTANEWRATVPWDGDYVVMISAPGHDMTSREITIDAAGVVSHPKQSPPDGAIDFSSDPLALDAYLPPLFRNLENTAPSPDELPTANLLVFAFYDNYVNGEPDDTPEDLPLNGVTWTVCNEEGTICTNGMTGSQPVINLPGGGVITDTAGLYYFRGLPPGEVIATSDPSTIFGSGLPQHPDTPVFTSTTGFYLNYTEEGGSAWDPKLYPGDPGTEAGAFLIWHGYVEKLGQVTASNWLDRFSVPQGVNTNAYWAARGSISGCVLDADGNDVEEPLPDPGPPGVSSNQAVPDALLILFTSAETVPVHPVATAETTTNPVTGAEEYTFENIPPGSYKMMVFDVPLDYVWVQAQITVRAGENIVGPCNPLVQSPADPWVPRFFARGQGYVVDRTGKLPTDPLYDAAGDPLDPVIAGAEVHIRYKSGSIKKTEFTGTNGWYNFDNLPEIEVLGHVDVELPPNMHGALVEETFTYNVNTCSISHAPCKADFNCPNYVPGLDPALNDICVPECPPLAPPGNPACVGTTVTHNSMNRYLQWFTANYRGDLFLEEIPAGTGDIRGVVWSDHLSKGAWVGDGIYERDEERTLHGVTIELWDATGTIKLGETTTGKVDKSALLAQGWTKAYTKPADEWGGVYVGPAIGFYEFRGLTPGSYTVKVIPPAGFSLVPGASGAVVVAVGDGLAAEHDFGVNTRPDPLSAVGVPLAGEIEGGVWDDLNIDPRPESTMYMEKAAIPGAPVGVYDHLGYLMGVGFQGDPACWDGSTICPEPQATLNPIQKPEMERRFAPSVHIYWGNDPHFPSEDVNTNGVLDPGEDRNHNGRIDGHNPNYIDLILPYTFGQGKFKFEADWSLPPLVFLGLDAPPGVTPLGGPLGVLPPDVPMITNVVPAGDSFLITGHNFGEKRNYATVSVSGKELPVSFWSDGVIMADALPGTMSGPLLVTTAAGPSRSVPVDTGFAPAGAVYVDARVAVSGDGSKANPWTTINEALTNLAGTPGPKYVFVGPGKYREQVHITQSNTYLIGAGPHQTRLDSLAASPPASQGFANGAGPSFYIGAGGEFGAVDNVMISGFTITNANVDNNEFGGGIFSDYGNTNVDINNNLIVQNGGYYGGGIWMHNSNHNARIWSNTIAENGNFGGYGGGISVNDEPEYGHEHSEPEHVWDDHNPGPPPGVYEIFNNHIFHNFSPDYGGGICLYEVKDHLMVYGNVIEDNKADDHGGGAYFEDTGPIDIFDNTFLANFCRDDGGAISFEDVGDDISLVRIFNNVFAENIADDCGENHARGGALAFDDTFYVEVFNNTIVNNIVAGSYNPAGGGIDAERNGHEYNGSCEDCPYIAPGFSDPMIYNNVIWGNMRLNYEQDQLLSGEEEDLCHNFGVSYNWTPDDLHVDNPAVQSEWESFHNSESFTHVEYNDISPGGYDYAGRPGNISIDPQLVDPAAYDWHLSASSPVINLAPGATAPERDRDGLLRRLEDGWADMGAYEFDGIQDDQGLAAVAMPSGDLDGDGWDNNFDNCPLDANSNQLDTDGDGVGDVCDNCPLDVNANQADLDGDGLGDACDSDVDGDGVDNATDNCLHVPNPGQADGNSNGVGDCCEPALNDADDDGVTDACDNCPSVPNGPAQAGVPGVGNQTDTDDDGVGDACDLCGDLDSDGDVDGEDFGLLLGGWGRCTGEPGFSRQADLDGDGCINIVDYQLWIDCYRTFVGNPLAGAPVGMSGDFDGDGDVDLTDYASLQRCLPTPPASTLPCVIKFDFNGDQRVDLLDFEEFAGVLLGP